MRENLSKRINLYGTPAALISVKRKCETEESSSSLPRKRIIEPMACASPSEIDQLTTPKSAKRKVSVMKDPALLSASSRRRVRNEVSDVIQKNFNYTSQQVEQIGHLLISNEDARLISNNMSASDDTSTQMVSSLVMSRVEKTMQETVQ